ncbi:hypothetical protein [Ralstonia solanacearum]|nr:hypothetical protein [Ralstonia solanacearum]
MAEQQATTGPKPKKSVALSGVTAISRTAVPRLANTLISTACS